MAQDYGNGKEIKKDDSTAQYTPQEMAELQRQLEKMRQLKEKEKVGLN